VGDRTRKIGEVGGEGDGLFGRLPFLPQQPIVGGRYGTVLMPYDRHTPHGRQAPMPAPLPDRNNPCSKLVSVIIPSHLRVDELRTALASVQAQTYRPIEVLVIDDGSGDAVLSSVRGICSEFGGPDMCVTVLQQPHRGAPAARNLGIRESRGEYLQFLDSDDVLQPNKLSWQIAALEQTGADVAISNFSYVEHDTGAARVVSNEGHLRWRMIRGWSVWGASGLIRAASIRGRLWWNEELSVQQDIDFMFRLLASVHRYVHTPFVGAHYIQHDRGRISDEYLTRRTPWLLRIRLLLQFMASDPGPRSPRGLVMTALGIAKLSVSAALDELRTRRAGLRSFFRSS
jgi:hypothetical protein